MSEDDYEEPRQRSERYPWEVWFATDNAREIQEGGCGEDCETPCPVHYKCATKTMRVMLIQKATKRGLKVRMNVYTHSRSIVFRAYTPRDDGRIPRLGAALTPQAAEQETGKDAILCRVCQKALTGQATHYGVCYRLGSPKKGDDLDAADYFNEHTDEPLK